MRVAVVDIGSNTARLLVASVTGDDVLPLEQAKAYLRLGAEVERRGTLRPRTIAAVGAVAQAYAARALHHEVDAAEVLVTAPGRQARAASELVDALAAATSLPVRILSHREEGGLAFDGAVARAGADLPDVVGVVDVGGGSTEIAVGTPMLGAAWVHSLDVGSLRLTRRLLPDDPPTAGQIEHARAIVERSLREVDAPLPEAVLAVGGTARALGRPLGERYGADELDTVIEASAGRSLARTARALGIDADRATTVVGGAILLAAVARLLGGELRVARGGLREGAALALAHAPIVTARAAA